MPERAPPPREVGGLWCDEVLGRLPDYVGQTLDQDQRAAVDAHLQGCDWCARFGGRYAATIQQLQQALAAPPAVSEALRGRLRARLEQETGGG